MNRNGRRSLSFKRALVVLAIVAGVLVLSVGALFLWALASTDSSLLARGLVWGDRRIDDWQRLPSRAIAPSASPIRFESSSPAWLAELTIDGQPLGVYLEEHDTTGFVILHGDTVLYEAYFNGADAHTIMPAFSATKSFVSALVGIAIEDGAISDLDDPVTRYVPELVERDPAFSSITIRHLVSMTSGIRFERYWSPYDDSSVTYWSPDKREAALESRIAQEPGRRFLYNDYNPILIGMVLERATGMAVSEYLESRLWVPVGAEAPASWSLDSTRSGFEAMSVGINGRAIDLAKLGWLYLNRGRVRGRQVIPEAWVKRTTASESETDGTFEYQYGWWINEHRGGSGYSAEGDLGQFICVFPESRLVIARFGNSTGDVYWTGLIHQIAEWIDGRQSGT